MYFYLLKHIRKHLHYKFLMCFAQFLYLFRFVFVFFFHHFYGLFFDSINFIALEKLLSDLWAFKCKIFHNKLKMFFFSYIHIYIECVRLRTTLDFQGFPVNRISCVIN